MRDLHARTLTLALALVLALTLAPAATGAAPGPHAAAVATAVAPPNLPALIECRDTLLQFQALAPVLEDPLRAVALGWRPLPQANLFMTEFALPAAITVLGHQSRQIAFSGDTILAILDLPDPRPLALELKLEAAIDTPTKVMYGKELRSTERLDPETGEALVESAVLAVSNVDSHPGKTLVGCSYSLDLAEEPESGPATPTEPVDMIKP